MGKAGERALEKYPYAEVCREKYLEGYHQAEKDLELSWRDIEAIDQLLWNLCEEYSAKKDNEGYFKEVLKRFKAMKDEDIR